MGVRRAPLQSGLRRATWLAVLSNALLVVLLLPGSARGSRAGRALSASEATLRPPPSRLVTEIRTEVRALDGLGVSVAVSRGGKLEWAAGFGSSDLAAKLPATARTVYQIGSITKTFTAALVMQLVEEGKLALGDRVGQFVHGLPWGRKVTIAELLNHTSGIVDYVNSKPSLLGPDCHPPSVARCPALTPTQVTGWLAHHPLKSRRGRSSRTRTPTTTSSAWSSSA